MGAGLDDVLLGRGQDVSLSLPVLECRTGDVTRLDKVGHRTRPRQGMYTNTVHGDGPPEGVQAREIILETYPHDSVVKGDRNISRRIHFGQDSVGTVRELYLAWEAVKEVLGHSHTIFNKFDNTGRNKPRTPDNVPMKSIKTLVDVLSLTRWRQEQECADLRHLTDDQRKQVVDALRTLNGKLPLGVQLSGEPVYTNRVGQGIFCRKNAESISVQKARRNHF